MEDNNERELSVVERRLLKINDRIENHSADYDKFNLAVLKYERVILVKRLFGE